MVFLRLRENPSEDRSEMQILASLYRDIRRHGEEAYPHECCGALLGRLTAQGWDVVKAIRATNICRNEPHCRYEISIGELVTIERQARSFGLEIAGFYHSHPDHPAQWSENDYKEAHWVGCLYVITTIVNGKAGITNAYTLNGTREEDKRFEAGSIQIAELPESV